LKRDNFPALADRGKKCIDVKIAFLLNTHNWLALVRKFAPKTQAYEE